MKFKLIKEYTKVGDNYGIRYTAWTMNSEGKFNRWVCSTDNRDEAMTRVDEYVRNYFEEIIEK